MNTNKDLSIKIKPSLFNSFSLENNRQKINQLKKLSIKRNIETLLSSHNNNLTIVSIKLNISKRSLTDKMRYLGIKTV